MSALPSILVIDDVIENVTLLGEALAELGEVRFATSGIAGLLRARHSPPDLILLDLMMPDVDGYEVCAALKGDPATRDIPVIFVTARDDRESELKGLAAGAVDFISKPIHPGTVRARVRLHLALREREQQLRVLNSELDQLVVQRTQALSEALAVAQEAVRVRSEFLANMSHELRTPLNAVIGLARIGVRDRGPSQVPADHYQAIGDAAEHLLGVVNDVLDFSKIQAGKTLIEIDDFNPIEIIESAIAMIQASEHAEGLDITADIAADLPVRVSGDGRRLKQILVNLLSNAVKFTDAGRVCLAVRRAGEQWRFSVRDTGIVMDAQQLSRLFEPFMQGDGSMTRRVGGAGLGLVISQSLAWQMHGDLAVSSRPGEGSEFVLSLPLPPSEGPAPVSSSGPEAPGTACQGQRLDGLRLLVAEDIELNRFLIGNMLEYEGAVVEFAVNGLTAVERVADRDKPRFDVLIFDIQMPVMDGLEAARQIRLIEPGLPVIALTAHALAEERARSVAAGLAAHVTKPVDIDELVAAVLRALAAASPA